MYVPDNLLSSHSVRHTMHASNHVLVTPYFVQRGCIVGLVKLFQLSRKMQGLARKLCSFGFFSQRYSYSIDFGVVLAGLPTFQVPSQEHVKEAKKSIKKRIN